MRVGTRRARLSLEGLSLGDAFGERFFDPDVIARCLDGRILPPGPWRVTDDTMMALSVVEELESGGRIDSDRLARRFADRWAAEPDRGYGPGAEGILREIAAGRDWREASRAAFAGAGSRGNGAAMRAAPIGAFFEGDPDRAASEAAAAAVVTHAHPEGRAGAIAVARAAAILATADAADDAFRSVIDGTPPGETRDGLQLASGLTRPADAREAADRLGSGQRGTAADTVPYAVACAIWFRQDFASALWQTVGGLGDRDTTCAIVGGLVILVGGAERVPPPWFASRESLETLSVAPG